MHEPLTNRILPRYAFETRSRIRLTQGGDERPVGGRSRNISESGLAAFVAEELKLGQIVTLEIPASKAQRLTISARVARRLGPEYGFQFMTLSGDQRLMLRRAMKGEPLRLSRNRLEF
jgi:hypothetical protein